MSAQERIGFTLTKKDTDIIEWLNMLQANDLSPATWVQLILLAEQAHQEVDAGGVYIPSPKKSVASLGLFGDDTVQKDSPTVYGWNIRGTDGSFVVGSAFTVRITRPIVMYIVNKYLVGRRMQSRYIKAILRKHIRHLSQPPHEPPIMQNVEDIFVLYEEHFPKFDARKYGSRSKKEVSPRRSAVVSSPPPVGDSLADEKKQPKMQSVISESPVSTVGVTASEPRPAKNPLLTYIN